MAINWFELKSKLTMTFLGIVTAIAGGIIAVESRYAHADDIKEVLRGQQNQMDLYKQQQTETQLFQLEYYNNRIRRLEESKRRAAAVQADPKIPTNVKNITRPVDDINEEIVDTKRRKEFVERSISRARQ